MTTRKPYSTNVSDEEWSFAAPYLTLMNEAAPQRRYELRANKQERTQVAELARQVQHAARR